MPEVERKKKELMKVFTNNGLTITVKTNLKTADFLDIHFDLVKEICQRYKKPNDDPLYINKKCNHPPSILQQLQKFNQINVFLILKESGYNVSLKYTPTQNQEEDNQQREQRKQKII